MTNETKIECEGQILVWGEFKNFHLTGKEDDGAMGAEWVAEVEQSLNTRGEWLAGPFGCDIRLAK